MSAPKVVARRQQVAKMLHAGLPPAEMVTNLARIGIATTPQTVKNDVKYLEAEAMANFGTPEALRERLARKTQALDLIGNAAYEAAARNPDDPDLLKAASNHTARTMQLMTRIRQVQPTAEEVAQPDPVPLRAPGGPCWCCVGLCAQGWTPERVQEERQRTETLCAFLGAHLLRMYLAAHLITEDELQHPEEEAQ